MLSASVVGIISVGKPTPVLPNLQFGSINKREFVTRIVAGRQEVTQGSGICALLYFFQRWELQIPKFFSAELQIQQNGGVPSVASEQSSSAANPSGFVRDFLGSAEFPCATFGCKRTSPSDKFPIFFSAKLQIRLNHYIASEQSLNEKFGLIVFPPFLL